ncbi:hypothetical protein [Salibacter halophilus]|uniref:Uncharacterized protein n=1 Tax=Salibacter halophilus TaxID=1803916 RepID=A0A6N6M9E6_9FLAO|nr:hypothetical protein [Salibacter halophilus]KAB1065615.1 hypothetical protein F3059_02880 [Salibacter halophilus]
MKVVDIFAVSDSESLLSVKWDIEDEESDEFNRVFDFLTDAEMLYTFFKEHKDDLESGFYGNTTIRQAVINTRREALELKRDLIDLSENKSSGNYSSLKEIFTELSPVDFDKEFHARLKAYGAIRKSMIRIYAVRLTDKNAQDHQYLVTGGTIKLTPKMQDRDHTRMELKKLEKTVEYLRDEGIFG